ncbi:MAG: SpoIIE family protein phosphatase [Gammaproteobacteria bacterium]|nr:SpoIIE family protein phosphatase [Gammaproteobacteria bacterium]
MDDQTDGSERLNILIADDNTTDRMILRKIVQSAGHAVVEASDGIEAVEQFEKVRPDLVLLDALMPGMDGLEAAQQIKALSVDDLIPIIFLTSLTDAGSLADCLNAGGDDFLSKPYNSTVLKAKIAAMSRLRKLNTTVLAQRDRITEYNHHLIREQEVAKSVFDNIAHPGCVDASNIKYILSPMAVFNGDILLAAQTPSGNLLVFLGDFTGHGLPAAIGAMPVAEIFYGMTLKGFAMSDILKEINKKLCHILPSGVFCCGCMVHLNFRKGVVNVWNGGLPDAVLLRSGSGEIEKIPSFNLPLGILKPDKFDAASKRYECVEGDRFFMGSDGMTEEQNEAGEMYGEERYFAVFEKNNDPSSVFEELQQSLKAFCPSDDQGDDHSLVEITFCQEQTVDISHQEEIEQSVVDSGPREWLLTYELRSDTLRIFNPLPLLTHVIREVPGLSSQSGDLHTILAELYYNALDHGVLGLDSKMKATPDGFSEYYRLKGERLEALEGAVIKISLEHSPTPTGGVLMIRIEDSGKGFAYEGLNKSFMNDNAYCGRGIPLLYKLCRDVRYEGKGNIVEVEYEWPQAVVEQDGS